MGFENIELSSDDQILIITISRPEKLNALSLATLSELKTVIEQHYDDGEVAGIIITGSGEKAFVAGADINEIANLEETTARKISENGQELFFLIENANKPIIAAINGYALGGGCELAMACHMRVASTNAQFGQPEVNLGIIPGYGGTQRLTQLVGKGKAIELMTTADMIGAEEAKQLGLVNHVVEQEELLPKCKEILNKIATKPPIQIGMVIDCVNAVYRKEEDGYQSEANAFARCSQLEDFKEGTQAFIEKRKANFKGQ